jgi:hypothetical protein
MLVSICQTMLSSLNTVIAIVTEFRSHGNEN